VPRWVLRIFLLRPFLRLARWLSDKLDALQAADFTARFVETNTTSAREERLEDLVRRTFRVATPSEKQRFCAFLEDQTSQDQHTVGYAEGIFEWQRSEIAKHKGALTSLRILELGPGHTIAPGLLLYAHGAARYVGADFFPIAGRSSEVYRRVRRHLAERPLLVPHPDLERARAEALRRFDEAVDLAGEDARFETAKVEWRHPIDASKLPFEDGIFDVVISNAAFEHFLEPEAAVREASRVLAPGGIGIHQIDLRDHRDFQKPLDFLRYEDAEWRRLNADMVCYTNRLRFTDFERAFTTTSTIERAEATLRAPVSLETRATFHARFRDRDDLDVLSATFVVRKPGPLS